MNKKLFPILILAVFLLAMLPAVSANKLTYLNGGNGNPDLKVTLSDTTLFGLIKTKELGTLELKSHKSINEIKKVGLGNQVTMYYDFDFLELYENGLGRVEFTDMRTGKLVDREYKFVYWRDEEYEVPVYSHKLVETKNGTINQSTQIGTKTKTRKVWLDYNSKDIPKGKIRIGIMVNNKQGDFIDGVWEIGDKKIKKHASWTANLNTNLVSYYKLDESSGSVLDADGSNDGTNYGATPHVTGKINTAYDFDGIDDYIDLGSGLITENAEVTINVWVKSNDPSEYSEIIGQTADSAGRQMLAIQQSSGKFRLVGCESDETQIFVSSTTDVTTSWQMVTLVRDSNSYDIYVNGNYENTATWDGTDITNSNPIQIGRRGTPSSGLQFDGKIDEVGIWDRVLTSSEVTQLYNNGNGLEYLQKGLDIYLNSPEDNFKSNNTQVTFNASVITSSSSLQIENVSLYLNGVLNETNSSGFNGTYIFNKNFAEGNYNWSILAYDNESTNYTSDTRDFSVDFTPPTISITSPTGTFNYLYPEYNLSLNWTANDTNLDTCWYNYNDTNTTVTCSDNQTYFNPISSETSLTFYVNDTFGNLASDITSWDYKIFDLDNYTYNAEIVESETISIKGQLKIPEDVNNVYLRYNGKTYTTSINSLPNDIYEFYSNIIAPAVTNDTNKTFNFIINGINTLNKTQLIKSVNIDNCTVYTNEILNLTLLDEEIFSSLTGKIYTNFQIVDSSENIIAKYEDKNDAIHTEKFCSNINLTDTNLYINAEIEYETENYSREFYHIQKGILSDYPKTLNLYNIKTEDSTKFRIIYQSIDLTKTPNAVVQLQRKYTYLNEFKTVEAPLTSSDSEAIIHVDTDSVKYKITITKDGEILSMFDNLVFQCDNELYGICEQKLLEPIVPTNLISLENLKDFSYSINTNKTNKQIKLDFSTPSATSRKIQLIVLHKTILGTSTICNKTITSSSGSLICNYNDTIADSNLIVYTYVDGILIAQKEYLVKEDLSDYFNKNNFLIVFIIGLSLVFMSTSSPEWIILNSVLTIVGAGALWLLNGMDLVMGLGGLIWIIGAGIILLLKTSKQEDN